MIFSKNALIKLNGTFLSDHNRKELAVDVERIEKKQRMANGTMRKYIVADKRTFSTGWTDIPGPATFTVDKHMGAIEMEAFYAANPGLVTMVITYANGNTESVNVMISKFDKVLKKRGVYDMYDVSMTLEEV